MRALRYVSLLLALQFVVACTPDASQPPSPPSSSEGSSASLPDEATTEKLVLAFGDSLYAGYGVAQAQSFPSVLERQLRAQGIEARVVNAGVSGDTSAAGRARLAFTLDGLPRTPDLAIVGLGGNDVLRGIDPAETRNNLEAIVRELDRRKVPVIITGLLAPRNMGQDYRARFDIIYPELAKRFGASLDPFFLEGVITRPNLMLEDGIHPNAAGIEVMAKRLVPMVAKELQQR